MQPSQGLKAIIIGGGIGGLTAAIALRQAGIDNVVYERADDQSKIRAGAGLHLWSNAMRALHQLGLGDRMEAEGLVMERAEFRSWRGQLLAAWSVGDLGRKLGYSTLCMSRADVHRILSEALDTGVLRMGMRCTGFSQDHKGVTAHFADGHEERGDLLIGADGIRSAVRAQQFGAVKPMYAGYTVWRALVDFSHSEAPVGVFRSVWGRGLRFVYYHIGKERLYWSCVANAPAGGRDDAGTIKTGLLERFKAWPQLIQTIIKSTEETAIQRLDTYELRPLSSWGEGRVTLLGDAAHPISFNIGQGACQAIEDGVVLEKCLSESCDVVAALRHYETRRMRRTASMQNLARRLGVMGRWTNPLGCASRDAFMRLTYNSVALKAHEASMAYEI